MRRGTCGFDVDELRSGLFEEPATEKPPALPVDSYWDWQDRDNVIPNRVTDLLPNEALPLNSSAAPAPGRVAEQDQGRQDTEAHTGCLIINADDWGVNQETTDRIIDCVQRGTISAVSAMVFMDDSARAAETALQLGVDAGLHLNLSTQFTSPACPTLLKEHLGKIASCLLRHPLSRVLYYPGLARSFEYVVASEFDEFCRLYGGNPERIDGHHHLHLCANVQRARLLPAGTLVRRNFSFLPGEKSLVNRLYRKAVDRRLARRHRVVDFLYNLAPLQSKDRLQRIFSSARNSVVEVETHPINPEEHRFLTSGEMLHQLGDLAISPNFAAHFAAPHAGLATSR